MFSVPLRLVLLCFSDLKCAGSKGGGGVSPLNPFLFFSNRRSLFSVVTLLNESRTVMVWGFFCFFDLFFKKVQTKVPQKFPCTTHRVGFFWSFFYQPLYSVVCFFMFLLLVFFFLLLFLDGQSVYAISKYYSNISLVKDSSHEDSSGCVSSMTTSPPAE